MMCNLVAKIPSPLEPHVDMSHFKNCNNMVGSNLVWYRHKHEQLGTSRHLDDTHASNNQTDSLDLLHNNNITEILKYVTWVCLRRVQKDLPQSHRLDLLHSLQSDQILFQHICIDLLRSYQCGELMAKIPNNLIDDSLEKH